MGIAEGGMGGEGFVGEALEEFDQVLAFGGGEGEAGDEGAFEGVGAAVSSIGAGGEGSAACLVMGDRIF